MAIAVHVDEVRGRSDVPGWGCLLIGQLATASMNARSRTVFLPCGAIVCGVMTGDYPQTNSAATTSISATALLAAVPRAARTHCRLPSHMGWNRSGTDDCCP
jgi:hypothetical protein